MLTASTLPQIITRYSQGFVHSTLHSKWARHSAMRGGRNIRPGIDVSAAFSSSFTPGRNGSPQTGTLSSIACSNGTTLTTNSPVASTLRVVSRSALQVNAMYMGSWPTRVQVPKAAAFTRPSWSTVVISVRHELGAKTLSHHSGLTSILSVDVDIVGLSFRCT